MFGNSIPVGLEFEFVELGMNTRTIVQNAMACIVRLREYQARLTFAAEQLTEWGIEPAAAEQLHKEVKIADDISCDVLGRCAQQ